MSGDRGSDSNRAGAGTGAGAGAGGDGLVERFEARAARCASLAELGQLLGEAAHQLGFDHFALLQHASLLAGGAGLLRVDNYPRAWVAELAADRLAADDPVHLASGRTNMAFAWDRLASLVVLTRRHREILERGRRHGIAAGFTVPANVPGEPLGSCSFAVRRGRAVPERHLYLAELIGARAFRTARRLQGLPAMGSRPRLSRREQQCLQLVVLGKSDWEIGRILGIGEATARHYVRRARSAYQVATRTQLAVLGLRDGWAAFGEASPPTGGPSPR